MAEESKKKYQIVYDREGCIGAAACAAVNAKDWEIVEDGKANLLKSKETSKGIWERIITEDELKAHMDAAESCPVRVIKIIDLETGKQMYP
ncbi:MAG: ferredoxin [Candidatus Woesearchaeota archaeon]|nr:ferredoxin [Candidatus Woesearchaeota archaeon]